MNNNSIFIFKTYVFTSNNVLLFYLCNDIYYLLINNILKECLYMEMTNINGEVLYNKFISGVMYVRVRIKKIK